VHPNPATKGYRSHDQRPRARPLADHLLTPQNAALLLIDYQPSQLAGVHSMDRDLLVKNAVSTVNGVTPRTGRTDVPSEEGSP